MSRNAEPLAGGTHIDALFSKAVAVRAHAYAPYSNFAVGAAILADDGNIYAGCNVENAAYPQGQCAEATTIGQMIAAGGRHIVEALVVASADPQGAPCSPCGGCRQRLREFANPKTPIHLCAPEGWRQTVTLAELLPWSFGPEFL